MWLIDLFLGIFDFADVLCPRDRPPPRNKYGDGDSFPGDSNH